MAKVAAAPAAETKRLFISGISANLSREELAQRLQNYGTLTDDLVLNKKNAETTGIFGHCGLMLDQAGWSRLRKLSGTVLKGSKLRIEEAKQDWQTRKALDQARPQPAVPNPRKRPARDTLMAVESRRVKRGEVVKDSSITQKSRKQGWIKGRYGRAIAVLKTEDGKALPRNPDALSRLWGSAHPKPDTLTYYYDDEEEEWHDRRGRVIRDVEITQKRPATEVRQGVRVEVWDSVDDDNNIDYIADGQGGDNAQTIGYMPATGDHDGKSGQEFNEEEIDAQLQQERSAGMSLLDDMFKGTEIKAQASFQQQEKRKVKDKLTIVQRYDPNAPDEESEPEPDNEQMDVDEEVNRVDTAMSDIEPAQESFQDDDSDHVDDHVDAGTDDEPSFLKPDLQSSSGPVPEADLVSIFHRIQETKDTSFRFTEPDDSSSDDDGDDNEGDDQKNDDHEEEDDDDAMNDAAADDTEDIHPDRLNRVDVEEYDQDEAFENANQISLGKDRGFNFSSVQEGTTDSQEDSSEHLSFFADVLPPSAERLIDEQSRREIRADYKRKLKIVQKRQRKARNRYK